MRPILLLAVLATVSFAPSAHAAPFKPAKPPPKAADDALSSGPKAYVGAWSVGKDGEGADVCTVRFNAAGVIGGFQLVAPKACKDAVPRWDDLYAWRVGQNGDIVMADATRRSVYVFHKLDDDVWATEGSDWERLLLQKATKVGVGK
ncbi:MULTISPECIES: AprI/Inh family metalloprotease inhibitor [unclassified Caulobacter]|uniref:AprI/Inh family metalloprotease inhibitor n=1 Tax=unclassified Caulobacter TaxID=2648921 RepID=UPI0004A7749E|nr:AprI/Inh family metalloprotease inhibitor [Caulobacter sp. UNC358MFTsu5.1]